MSSRFRCRLRSRFSSLRLRRSRFSSLRLRRLPLLLLALLLALPLLLLALPLELPLLLLALVALLALEGRGLDCPEAGFVAMARSGGQEGDVGVGVGVGVGLRHHCPGGGARDLGKRVGGCRMNEPPPAILIVSAKPPVLRRPVEKGISYSSRWGAEVGCVDPRKKGGFESKIISLLAKWWWK